MNPKPLYLKDKLSQFKKSEHKIIHRVLDDTGAKKIAQDDTWEHERFTRNALFDQVMLSLTGDQAPEQGDVLLVGDIDEIPRISTLTALRNCAYPLLRTVWRGKDLFERDKEVYDRIDENPDIPAYLQTEENRKRFAYMLDRDPPNANFQDL
ncbi:hypothetical protein P7C71_g4484, partial [Lecanoromycetidae sp. Uapishka_2]